MVTLDAWRYSTRTRKAATLYSNVAETRFIGLSGAGRAGRWDKAGRFKAGRVYVTQLHVRRPLTAPTRFNQWRNILLCYVPAFIRLAAAVLTTPAEIVHVTGAPLAALGLAHRARFRSRIILDIQERPGAVASRGSVWALFRHVELLTLHMASRFVEMATVVTPTDVRTVSTLGFGNVRLVRNAPLKNWRAPYSPPSALRGTPLSLVTIGTIFEGRGFEMLLHAVARASTRRPVLLKVYGIGRPDYLLSLRQLANELDISQDVKWMGAIDSSAVSSAYLDAHAGLVIYDGTDSGNDGLSNKIMECIASGRPVIASDLPENRRFVTNAAAGWLAGPTIDALAQTIVTTGGLDDDVLVAISARCRDHGEVWLNWESEFDDVLRLVKQQTLRPTKP